MASPPVDAERRLPSGAYLVKAGRGDFWLISSDASLGDLPAYIDWRKSRVKHLFVGTRPPAAPSGRGCAPGPRS